MRLATLLSKRQAAAQRILPEVDDREHIKGHVEWKAVEEGFTLLQNDLSKLQVRFLLVCILIYFLKRYTIAIRRDQCDRLPEDIKKVGQTIKVDHQRALFGQTSRGATRI